jgi:hypothetical protein
MAKTRKQASELTTTEAMNRIFGKGAAQRLREVVKQEDAKKGRKTAKPTKLKDDQ